MSSSAPHRYEDNLGVHYVHKGKCHRLDGPARIYPRGGEVWYQYGLIHRDDGPATTGMDNRLAWFQFGEYHRLDGPAIINDNGTQEYWVRGKRVETNRFLMKCILAKEKLWQQKN